MANTAFLDNIPELKNKFDKLHVHKKKIKAIEIYTDVQPINQQDKDYFEILKRCVKRGFPTEMHEQLIKFLLDEYHVNFLEWSHRTKWLKQKMNKMREENRKPQYVQKTFELPLTVRNSTTIFQNTPVSRRAAC